ncbi:hypothetical protein [Catellatospora sp. NPDC049133]|uniref:hypothetical protein n=1 Tax=Catellatospora sp. NPDC049133 TaxID=3155499 RepID=UPI0033C39BBB
MAAKPDGRAGGRRIRVSSPDPSLKPEMIVAAPQPALPGEEGPLVAGPGRAHAVTEEEALGVLRRRRRHDLAERYDGADRESLAAAGLPADLEHEVPAELPKWNSRKRPFTLRLPERLRALADAHAELEGTTFNALVELALFELIEQAPRTPEELRERYLRMAMETAGVEKLREQYK